MPMLSRPETGGLRHCFMMDNPEVTKIVGYDSCCVPALVNNNKGIDPQSYDSCEGRDSQPIFPPI